MKSQVVVDRRVAVSPVAPIQSSENARSRPAARITHLALLGRVVDDAGVVTRLRRQHQRRHHVVGRAVREVAQARHGALEHRSRAALCHAGDRVRRGVHQRAASLADARASPRHGDGAEPVLGGADGRRLPDLGVRFRKRADRRGWWRRWVRRSSDRTAPLSYRSGQTVDFRLRQADTRRPDAKAGRPGSWRSSLLQEIAALDV